MSSQSASVWDDVGPFRCVMGCLLERTTHRYVPNRNNSVPGVFIHTPILTTSEGANMISTAATVIAAKKWVEFLGQMGCQPRVLSSSFFP